MNGKMRYLPIIIDHKMVKMGTTTGKKSGKESQERNRYWIGNVHLCVHFDVLCSASKTIFGVFLGANQKENNKKWCEERKEWKWASESNGSGIDTNNLTWMKANVYWWNSNGPENNLDWLDLSYPSIHPANNPPIDPTRQPSIYPSIHLTIHLIMMEP